MIIAGREIKRLVASGCSFTYGQGIAPSDAWPAQLAKLLDIECVNLGLPGMGNEHVQTSIIDYFSNNTSQMENSFVIPCYSKYSRVEFPSKARKNYVNGQFTTVFNSAHTTIINGRIEPEFTQQFFENIYIPEYYYARYIRIIITLQSVLKTWDIPYLMFEGLSGNEHVKMIKDKNIIVLTEQIDRNSWLRFMTGNFDTMTSPAQRLPDGHPNANAHLEMANILYKHLREKYEDQQ
jgi:hypothetical protein